MCANVRICAEGDAMHDQELIEAEAREVGRRVREELARRRISRQALADMARISLSTLEKALAGTRPFTLATTLRIEEALGIALRPTAQPAATRDFAPEHMGAYARPAVAWLEGRYLTLRPSFGTPGAIYAYLTTIRWLDEQGHLGFFESERLDARFEQAGHVSLPNLSGHIYLVTNEQGQYRLLTLSRPTIDGTLFGVLATLQVGHGSQLVPVAAPVTMWKAGAPEPGALGLIAADSPHHAGYRAKLAAATGEDFVRLHQLA
jgi:transcriptional regulator with XRE-family HTH domain